MGFPTQSAHTGQAYSMGSVNPSNGICNAPLARQKSIYSLTLEEFQNTLGEPNKSFGSMNMEELLKNIWTAEESQAMVAAMGNADRPVAAIITQPSLPRQGSYSIRGALGRKTVDEVWKSVFQEHGDGHGESSLQSKPRQVTFGEITLEDFLMKAGVVKEEETIINASLPSFSFGGNGELVKSGRTGFEVGLCPNTSSMLSSSGAVLPYARIDQSLHVGTTSSALQGAYPNIRGQQHGQAFGQSLTVDGSGFLPSSANLDRNNALLVAPVGLGGLSSPIGGGIGASLNPGVNYGFKNGMSLSIPTFKADSPHSQSSDGTGTSHGNVPSSPAFQPNFNRPLSVRKRLAEGPAEMVVERRQRRMIKNRESAARSRARKQAYTVELENELSQLREENSMLMQKQEAAEIKLKQVLAMSREGKKRRGILRRTQTVPW